MNGKKTSQSADSRSLTLKFRRAAIGRFFHFDRDLLAKFGTKADGGLEES